MLRLQPLKMRQKMLVSTIRYNVIGQQPKSNMLRLHPLKNETMLVGTIRYNTHSIVPFIIKVSTIQYDNHIIVPFIT